MMDSVNGKKSYKNEKIWKANALVEAQYRLGLNEQRFLLICISKIKPTDKDFMPYIIELDEFKTRLRLENSNSVHSVIKGISKSILEVPIVIKRLDSSVLQCNWFSSCEYIKGAALVCYDPKLKPYLLEVQKNFTAYTLDAILLLPSAYAIRGYEIFKQYEKIGVRTEDIPDLRKILGIEPGKYKQYGHFKKRVLDYILGLIKKYMDIKVTYKEIKKGRKVVAIKFFISKNEKNIKKKQKKEAAVNQTSEAIEQADQTEKSDYEKIYALIPSPDNRYKTLPLVINPYLKKKGVPYTKAAVEYVVAQKPSKFMGYLKSALKENYAGFGKVKPDPKIAEAKAKYKECQVAKTHGTCPSEWHNNNVKTKACYYCHRFKKQRLAQEQLEIQTASKPKETVEAKPAPEIKPELQKVAAQIPPIEPQQPVREQSLSEVEIMKQQMQQMQQQMKEMQQAQTQKEQALQQKIQQLEAGKSAPQPIEEVKIEDIEIDLDQVDTHQPSPGTPLENRLLAKWWIIRDNIEKQLGFTLYASNIYPLVLDYSKSDESKLTLIAPSDKFIEKIIKKGYSATIQNIAKNIEIVLEAAPTKKTITRQLQNAGSSPPFAIAQERPSW